MTTIELDSGNIKVLKSRLIGLQDEHRKLDDNIKHLYDQAFIDQIQIRRMKKRKLQLKDEITIMKSSIIPDIDA